MKKVIVKEGQSIQDIAIQEAGNIGVLGDILRANDLNPDSDLNAGDVLIITDEVINYKPDPVEIIEATQENQEILLKKPEASIFDLTLQGYGDLNGLADLLRRNDLNPDSIISPLSEVKIGPVLKSSLVNFAKSQNITFASYINDFVTQETLLFDAFPDFFDGPSATAFGVVKVSSTYTGPCIRVCHPDTMIETDIGFIQQPNGTFIIDAAAAEAFHNGASSPLLVTRAYLQRADGTGLEYAAPPTLSNAFQFIYDTDNPIESYLSKVDGSYMDFTYWRNYDFSVLDNTAILNAQKVAHRYYENTIFQKDFESNSGFTYFQSPKGSGISNYSRILVRSGSPPTLTNRLFNYQGMDFSQSDWSGEIRDNWDEQTQDDLRKWQCFRIWNDWPENISGVASTRLTEMRFGIAQVDGYSLNDTFTFANVRYGRRFGAYRDLGASGDDGHDENYKVRLHVRSVNDIDNFDNMTRAERDAVDAKINSLFGIDNTFYIQDLS